ncbi:MAG: helix-turn-helix domain-containing protein [Pseudanabaena sp.]|jgi:transcriptional regulator with XRE-family HTH domain|nr:helix-turn-helix transcriptional regulator [Pseudanabaena sp. M172S2SP2A07QC]MCA6526910.1 helix-turn-helix transcriptional regulator [Pseudanabaena sp. M179S2SP2A07QC]MCA6532196.1 helix-turn-helix transcriptional regulator [Pseudanabaena sp. M125S2SP2A07QC]MCA6536918.1 helix-turn-helix transcriptional regulator [Pseudanabaena sp. M176S2SP2A07QC]MCA6538112.1 helix-turn-helix transcriptional regulator [Pseudanabaena sp. M037S2SP2A07QC]MCA6541719.1 helix-turn-helix transcriptional regulator [P
MNHAELKAQALSNPETLAAYESMDVEFSILRQMLAAREKAGLSQAQVAIRMGTKATAITRLESSLSSGKHSPSLITLRRYAQAVGCELEVKLVKSESL